MQCLSLTFSKNGRLGFVIESYVDDIFGDAKTKNQASQLKAEIIRTGIVTSALANFIKCYGPTQLLKILGMMYDAIHKKIFLPSKKVAKYLNRINGNITRKISNV